MENLIFKKLTFEPMSYIKDDTKEIYYDMIPHGFIFKIVNLETKEEVLYYAPTIKDFLEKTGLNREKDVVYQENSVFANFISSSYR